MQEGMVEKKREKRRYRVRRNRRVLPKESRCKTPRVREEYTSARGNSAFYSSPAHYGYIKKHGRF
jgi:hypothetical protein